MIAGSPRPPHTLGSAALLFGTIVAERARIGIIGAGVSGMSAAFELARRGITDVIVLDGEYVASGSSGRSIGLIETQYIEPLDIALRAISMRRFDQMERENGLRIVRNGYLRLTTRPGDISGFAASVEIQRGFGIQGSRVIEPEEVRAIAPDVYVGDVAAALWGPDDGFIDGHLYANLLAELAIQEGIRLRTRTRVEAAGKGERRRHRLMTSNGDFEFDIVVNASGAWAERVGSLLETRVPLQPQRNQVVQLHLQRSLDYLMPSVVEYSPGSFRRGLYLRHEADRQLLVGLHSEEAVSDLADPDDWFSGIDDEYVELIAEHLAQRLPGFDDAGIAGGWAGLYPISPDGKPQVGPCPEDETVIAACGVGGYGIQVAPVIGALVAEWIDSGEPKVLPEFKSLLPGRESLVEGSHPGGAT